jgi:heme oxygenase (biliverdin-IX-beta and delta-forming)
LSALGSRVDYRVRILQSTADPISTRAMPRSEILNSLRDHTQPYHDRLESGLDMLNPALSLPEYRHVLERFWGFCAPAEARIAEARVWEALGLDAAARDRAGRLRADLLHLGHDPDSLGGLPSCDALPRLDDAARAAGYLYVFEGATLGGVLIARHLQRTVGVTRESGAAFFGSYGAEIGPMWKAFTAALSEFAERTGTDAQIVDAACETFSTLERWLLPRPT